jgi:hypothetical protein
MGSGDRSPSSSGPPDRVSYSAGDELKEVLTFAKEDWAGALGPVDIHGRMHSFLDIRAIEAAALVSLVAKEVYDVCASNFFGRCVPVMAEWQQRAPP